MDYVSFSTIDRNYKKDKASAYLIYVKKTCLFKILFDFRFDIEGGNRNERCINNSCCKDWILKTEKNIETRGNNPFPRFIEISIILKVRLNRALKIHHFDNT